VGHPVLHEGRVGERSRTGGRNTAAVVHIDVDYHAAVFHLRDRLAVHEGRCAGAYDMYRPYKEVRAQHGVPDPEAARRKRRRVGKAAVFDHPQAVEVLVYDDDLGPETAGHSRGAGPDYPRPEDDHASWSHARRAAEQDAASPERALQVVGANLGGEAARDLAHRREHGQAAPRVPDRLHGEGDAPGVEEGLHQPQVDRQGEEGDQHQSLPQVLVLFLHGPVDFDHDLGIGVDPRRLLDETRAGILVPLVPDAGRLPRPGLHEDPVSRAGQLVHGVWGQRDPALPLGPLLEYPYPHRSSPRSESATTVRNTLRE
jgi:hypothetical protein